MEVKVAKNRNYCILMAWEHGNLKTDTNTYYNITLFSSANTGRNYWLSRQISDDIKQFSYEICQRHSVIIRYMETDKDHIHYKIWRDRLTNNVY